MFRIKAYHPPGTAPGTLTRTKGEAEAPLSIRLIDYGDDAFTERELASVEECAPFLERASSTWIQIDGRPDPQTLRALGTTFRLHDLALEDVVNLGQRPKIEEYDDQLFVVLGMPCFREGNLEIVQISLFAGENYLICFCPLADDPFEPVRRRLRPPNNQRIRSRRVDYLLYALVDLVVDQGFPVLEAIGERLEGLEDQILDQPTQETVTALHGLRRELLQLRRQLWPQREVIGALLRGDHELIEERTQPYLRDCYDHSIQLMDLQESFRELSASLLDAYLSSISHRTNEIMRVLTIIATIFIPLTFVVGIYGMNFEHPASPWAMPELGWYYGYPLVWLIMLVLVGGMVWFFRRRGWL